MYNTQSPSNTMRQRALQSSDFSPGGYSDGSMPKQNKAGIWAGVIGVVLVIVVAYLLTTKGNQDTTIQV